MALDHDSRRERIAEELGAQPPKCLQLLGLIRNYGVYWRREFLAEVRGLGIGNKELLEALAEFHKRAYELRGKRYNRRVVGKPAIADPARSQLGPRRRKRLVLKQKLARLLPGARFYWCVEREFPPREAELWLVEGEEVSLNLGRQLLEDLAPPYLSRVGRRLVLHTRSKALSCELEPKRIVHKFEEVADEGLSDQVQEPPASDRLRRGAVGAVGP